ncbi:GNAT family N-acetyltransferase [Macrococcoides caseolyticum]|uniref:GNAT family N-acetyltransferase n=1 Tax=Macrococcoides caseolyticum TaxID=69966 RepID=UPI001F4901F9|nr:GNAT family N-acetyltransferase [Macrococcus caseolyticus]MCE4955914.1 GNAT family N-acetyltransferase [Macrococcus caseolyticus]
MHYFETERLIFRDWHETDLPYFQDMNKDFDVRRYFPDVLSHSRSTLAFFMMQHELKTHGIGLFAVELKSSGQFIGLIGIQQLKPTKHFNLPFMPCYEIGWRLRKSFWHQGYATEGAIGVIKYAASLGVTEIYSYTSLLNRPSRHIMEKLDMTFVETFNHPLIHTEHPLREQVLYYKSIKELHYDSD